MSFYWFTALFCPIAGIFITNIMWLSPLGTILKSRSQTAPFVKVNPTPFSFMIVNCLGWVIYALMINNLYVFLANVSGVVLGVYYLMTVMMVLVRTASQKNQAVPLLYYQLERHILFALTLWMVLSLVCTSTWAHDIFHSDRLQLQRRIIGNAVMICNVAYYAAPFSTLVQVVRSKDSSSILAVMVFANLLDASLWLVYACAINDWYLMIPNVLGVFLAVSQLMVRLAYCAKSPPYSELSSTVPQCDDLTPTNAINPATVVIASAIPVCKEETFTESTTVLFPRAFKCTNEDERV